MCFSYVCLVCACLDLLVSSSSWGLGRAAVCYCGTPWTFLLPFFDISCKLSPPYETISIKCQSLFSGKKMRKIIQYVMC